MLFNPANLPYWILLGMGVLLFLFVIASGGGGEDIDVDADVDVDVDADLDADAGFDFAQAMGWLGIGKSPLILLLATDLSVWGVLGWMLNVVVGGVLGFIPVGLVSGLVLFSSLVASLVTGGLIAKPMGQIFAAFGEDASSDRLVGCIGTVSTALIPGQAEGRIGQVDVLDPARNLVTVNAVLPGWATVIPRRGDKVLVIERPGQTYFVIAKDSPDQEHWFNSSSSKNPR
jgi:Protein of unknown function (DUF1449)